MKENKYLKLSIAVSIAAVIWALFPTVICVKQERKIQGLKEQVNEYKDLYHGCLQGKMRLQNMKIVSDRDVLIEFEK